MRLEYVDVYFFIFNKSGISCSSTLFWLLGKQPQEIHESMVRAYGEESFSLSFVKKWKVMFDNGRTSIEDDERTGRPFIKENVERVSEYINDYPFSSARSIASALDIDKKTVIKI